MNKSFLHILIILVVLCFVMLKISCRSELAEDELIPFEWTSDFEAGAAASLHLRKDGAIGFSIPEEPGDGEYLWFYFKIESNCKQPLEFVLENASGAHQTGRRWSITSPVFSSDGHTWVKAEESHYSFLRHRLWKYGFKLFGKPVFRFQSPFIAETLWVAYSYPYTLNDLNRFVEKIRDLPEVTISTIGKSEEKREILNIKISRTPSPSDEKGSQVVWIIAREHPGETPASFVCEGMIQTLLTTPAGKRLREKYEFNIIPVLNVDGVAHGYYYHNVNGVNLARDWDDYRSIEVRALRDALFEDIERKMLRLVINLHSSNDPMLGHFFIKMPESELQPEDIEFQRAIFRGVNGIYPQIQGKSTVTLLNIPGITGRSLYSHHNVYCLYLESNYSRGADGSLVTLDSLRETGSALVQALAKVL